MARRRRRYDSMAIDRPFTRVRKHGQAPNAWLEGEVVTHHGIVSVYSQGHDGEHRASSRYDFVQDGRYHMVTEPVARTERGLAIVAHRIIREAFES